ncbi:hypothetical protein CAUPRSCDRAFT_10531 [Caulochytrium protostelioides]|uniref:Uncharacterized protein n=1 Tax=Caulochytrium protostelioides TaxID=1555241 RepID=A0A4P9WWM8_9FUNG|nr:hypothetical protein CAUPRSCDRAFT_10531 [Caulochytrium protostelioides]
MKLFHFAIVPRADESACSPIKQLTAVIAAGQKSRFYILERKEMHDWIIANPKGDFNKAIKSELEASGYDPAKNPDPWVKLARHFYNDIKATIQQKLDADEKSMGAGGDAGMRGQGGGSTSPTSGKDPNSGKRRTRLKEKGDSNARTVFMDEHPIDGADGYVFVSGFHEYTALLTNLLTQLDITIDVVFDYTVQQAIEPKPAVLREHAAIFHRYGELIRRSHESSAMRNITFAPLSITLGPRELVELAQHVGSKCQSIFEYRNLYRAILAQHKGPVADISGISSEPAGPLHDKTTAAQSMVFDKMLSVCPHVGFMLAMLMAIGLPGMPVVADIGPEHPLAGPLDTAFAPYNTFEPKPATDEPPVGGISHHADWEAAVVASGFMHTDQTLDSPYVSKVQNIIDGFQIALRKLQPEVDRMLALEQASHTFNGTRKTEHSYQASERHNAMRELLRPLGLGHLDPDIWKWRDRLPTKLALHNAIQLACLHKGLCTVRYLKNNTLLICVSAPYNEESVNATNASNIVRNTSLVDFGLAAYIREIYGVDVLQLSDLSTSMMMHECWPSSLISLKSVELKGMFQWLRCDQLEHLFAKKITCLLQSEIQNDTFHFSCTSVPTETYPHAAYFDPKLSLLIRLRDGSGLNFTSHSQTMRVWIRPYVSLDIKPDGTVVEHTRNIGLNNYRSIKAESKDVLMTTTRVVLTSEGHMYKMGQNDVQFAFMNNGEILERTHRGMMHTLPGGQVTCTSLPGIVTVLPALSKVYQVDQESGDTTMVREDLFTQTTNLAGNRVEMTYELANVTTVRDENGFTLKRGLYEVFWSKHDDTFIVRSERIEVLAKRSIQQQWMVRTAYGDVTHINRSSRALAVVHHHASQLGHSA